MAKKLQPKAKIQTVVTEKSVDSFIDNVEPETKRDDTRAVVKLMSEVSKEPPKMWGPAIIGFGQYHYVYESGRNGDMPLIAVSPRKQNIVLYLMGIVEHFSADLKKLGKYKTGVGCIYFNKLDEVDTNVLKSLMKKSMAWTKSQKKLVSQQKKK